jgi:hypothetical protein
MSELHRLFADAIGYHDAIHDKKPDAKIISSEYRRYYVVGYARGRRDLANIASFAREADENLGMHDEAKASLKKRGES